MNNSYIISQDVKRVTSHYLYFSMCSECPCIARTQAVVTYRVFTRSSKRPANVQH